MVIDTSGLLAFLRDKPERQRFTEAIESVPSCPMSAASFVAASIVIEVRHGAEGLRDLDLLISRASIELVPVDAEQAAVARRAFSHFGKGRHPAASTSETVSRTHWPAPSTSPCSSRAATSPKRIRHRR